MDEVRTRTDLGALMGRDLEHKPSGSVLKARSPANRDGDPAFVVLPTTLTWHDFSGARDCFHYLVRHRGLRFVDALRMLAADVGVPMPGWSPAQAQAEVKRLIEAGSSC